jgi:hypothetical protein
VPEPRRVFESRESRREREHAHGLHGAEARVEAVTTIHVTGGGGDPIHVALLEIGGRRVFAKLDHAASEAAPVEQVLAGQKVKFLVKDDGDHYFQIPRERSLDLGRVVQAIRRRVGA